MKLLTLRETAAILGLSPTSLANVHYRQRLGLPIVKIGAAVRIIEQDLTHWITRHREPVQVQEGPHGTL